MPDNFQINDYIREERGVIVFCEPGMAKGELPSKVQIVDIFSLQLVCGFEHDEKGNLCLISRPFINEGKIYSAEDVLNL